MSIVRVGSTKEYSDGWDAAFSRGGSKSKKSVKGKPKTATGRGKPAKKSAKKKRGK